ncbi:MULTISPECIES: PTS ascorbate transporter subunit IIC [Hungatella]|jgi:PTS system ascorbate-specific IIC component|uniref:PTS ascorbate transporter subunit IIC n=1 Tax=Hungatella TaxID=1649459 RepID=UPI0011DDF7A1|nr:PTS ascorbate transporter subunit IIC [Hungatella hathewayi]
MGTLGTIATWLSNNFFNTPAFLLMLVVLIGHLLQKSPYEKTVSGTLKAGIGFLVISSGSNIVTGALKVFEPLWSEVFGLPSAVLTNCMGYDAFVGKFGSVIAIVMATSFLINVILARITPFKYIFLTGHELWWVTVVSSGVLINFAPEMATWKMVCILAPVLGLYFTLQPAICQKYVRNITGGNDFALAHPSGVGSFIAANAGKVFAKNKKDAETIVFSKRLSFLRDNNVITALVMMIFYLIGAVIVMVKNTENGQALMANAGTQNFIVYAVVQSLTFAAGIAVILVGVRLFVGEIIPSFKGIADKLVPNAIPALDCPVLFTYSPNSVILGFVGMFAGIIFWMLTLGLSIGFVVVPTMIVLFFHGATAGIFGNSTGGIKGALLGGFIISTIVALGQLVFIKFLVPATIPDTIMWAGETDEFLLFWIFALFGRLFG